MALGKTKRFRTRTFAIALAVMAGFSAINGSTTAQVYWGDRPSGDRRSRGWGWDDHRSGGWGWGDRYPSDRQRDFFSPFFGGDRYNRPAPAVDYSKAPPPRKLETPPSSTVVVIGDSFADWLAYGLDEFYSDQAEIGIARKIAATSGLIRYDAKNDRLDWWQVIKDALASEKPDAIVVMLGLNDRVPLRDKLPPPPSVKRAGETGQAANQPTSQAVSDKAAARADTEVAPQAAAEAETQRLVPGGSYDFHTEQWATLYAKRIDEMIAALKSKGVPVIWVGSPAIRGTKSTSDMSYLDELYRERAAKAGIVYVDVWDGFVDDQGRYVVQGPDFEGQTRRLRTADGVHFTKAGAVKLASYVDRELRRAMSIHVAPVALPAPEAAPKSETRGTRPDVGPVLPLTSSGGDSSELAGAAGRATQAVSDPVAVKVLTRGDPLPAPPGRSDDFTWPRPGNDAIPEASLQPVAVAPSTPGKKDTAARDDTKKSTDAKKDAKEKSASDSGVSKKRHTRNVDLDGAPIPPAPVGSR